MSNTMINNFSAASTRTSYGVGHTAPEFSQAPHSSPHRSPRTLANNFYTCQDDGMKTVYIQRLQAALLSINYKRKYIEERFQAAREELHTEMRVNKRLRGMLEARLGVGPELLASSHCGPMHMHHAPPAGPSAAAPPPGLGAPQGHGHGHGQRHPMPASHQIPGLREGAVFMEIDDGQQGQAGPGQLQLHAQQPGFVRESMGETC